MTTSNPLDAPRYLLGRTCCSGYDYRGGADAVLLTVTDAVIAHWQARMATVRQLQEEAPEIIGLLERDLRPLLLADEIRLTLDLDCEDDWSEITAVEHQALLRLAREWTRGPRIYGLSAYYCEDEVYWTMYVTGTDIEITTPALSRTFLDTLAVTLPSRALIPA